METERKKKRRREDDREKSERIKTSWPVRDLDWKRTKPTRVGKRKVRLENRKEGLLR